MHLEMINEFIGQVKIHFAEYAEISGRLKFGHITLTSLIVMTNLLGGSGKSSSLTSAPFVFLLTLRSKVLLPMSKCDESVSDECERTYEENDTCVKHKIIDKAYQLYVP